MRIRDCSAIVAVIISLSGPLCAQKGLSSSQARSFSPFGTAMKDTLRRGWIDSSGVSWYDSISREGVILQKIGKGYTYVLPVITVNNISSETNSGKSDSHHPKFLQVKGNILYDVNYRSRIDTPYAENHIYQHTLQTRLDFLYKEQYPFKVYLTTRFSNSSLFRKYTDLNFQYRQADFARLLKQKIIKEVESYLLSRLNELDSLKRQIELKKARILSLSRQLKGPDVTQKLVEEKERSLFESRTKATNHSTPGNSLTTNGTIGSSQIDAKAGGMTQNDSSISKKAGKGNEEVKKYYSYKDSLENKRTEFDSLVEDLNKTVSQYNNLKITQQLNADKWKKQINEAKDAGTLTQELQKLKLPDTLLPKGYKTLYSIQSFNVGRAMVNYSELSVKDISITGVQMEYNPHYYYAFAVGKIDYRFRDYIVPAYSRSNQYLAIARFGKGMRNGNHVIFTYYTGKRQFFNSSIAAQPGNIVPSYNLAGITIEGFYKLNRNISLIAEVAKSTVPYYGLDSLQRKTWMNSMMRFKNRSNEAYSVMLNSYLPKTETRFTGKVKYLGANFQSFSTFTTGASQVRWLARLEQPFFKRKLDIVSSIEQNDYNNPFVTTTYKNSSILASFQASLRIKHWPFLSVGYYPSYQLTKISNSSFSENRYYTLVANSGYYYHIHSVQLYSYAIFSKFYNASRDSGFVYFNSKNLLLSQGAYVKRFSIQLDGSISANTGYSIYTIENSDQFTISKLLSVGAGLKLIRQTLLNYLLYGYSCNVRLTVSKVGSIQFMMDKGFIPGLDRRLVANNTGRLTYFKNF